jgi:hypothetical protein
MDKKVVHLINENGQRITMEMGEYNSKFTHLNETMQNSTQIDINWYLSHGYKTIKQVRKNIENGKSE